MRSSRQPTTSPKSTFWKAFNSGFLEKFEKVNFNSTLKNPECLLLADISSSPWMNWVKSMMHFLMTPAVLDSSSWLLLKVSPSSILPSSCRMTCFISTSPMPFLRTW